MTSSSEPLGPCQENAGFLFAHDCPRRAQQRCAQCRKPICAEHGHGTGRQVRCTTCTRADRQNEPDTLHPLLFASHYYQGHGKGGRDAWGDEPSNDPNDFTEADGAALRERDNRGSFEEDMEGS